MSKYVKLTAGDAAPWFHQRSHSNENYSFDTAAGRYVVLCFFVSSSESHSQAALKVAMSRRDIFDDVKASFFGVSNDPNDESKKRVADSFPGYRYFWDFDGLIGKLYGALPVDQDSMGVGVQGRQLWVILDPTMRVMKVIPFEADQSDIPNVLSYLDSLPPPSRFAGAELQAPILLLPNVFEPKFCQTLIAFYESKGSEESGFMRDVGGKTVLMTDYGHKRRRDCFIEDAALIKEVQMRITRRIVPEIKKVHQFEITRMERNLVGCYEASDAAHFKAHRDNTTKGTAHRRFAVSINLNDDFEGREVSFPEYGPRSFKAPIGGAVVFSCSLLHAVSQVIRGRRFAFLPFLYDDAAAKIREANTQFLGEKLGGYKAANV